jgi:RNA polymerase sigma factor (sigma-70 family)
MSFPETRATLILRLAGGGTEADWRQFLSDYWGPLARFAARSGNLPLDQAEDVAAETFVVLLRSPVLSRWHDRPAGKLRTLLCGVVRNLLSNRQRVAGGRRRLLKEVAEAGGIDGVLPVADSPEPSAADLDAFYHAWVDELLAGTMQRLMKELHTEGHGDCFRALYGRVCEGLSAAEIADAIGVKPSEVESYLRLARSRLTQHLQADVRRHVEQYSAADSPADAFQSEWDELHRHLEKFGGLDAAIRQEASRLDRLPVGSRHSASFQAVNVLVAATQK